MNKYVFTLAALSLLMPAVPVRADGGPSDQGEPERPSPSQMCPMKTAGAEVTVKNIKNGVTVTISSDDEDKAAGIWTEVEKHLEFVEKMKNGPQKAPEVAGSTATAASFGPDETEGKSGKAKPKGPKMPMCPTMIRGAEAKAEKTDSGAVITITGKDSETAGKIQKAAAEAMKSNDETTEEEGTDKEEQTGNRPPFRGGAGGPPPDMRE